MLAQVQKMQRKNWQKETAKSLHLNAAAQRSSGRAFTPAVQTVHASRSKRRIHTAAADRPRSSERVRASRPAKVVPVPVVAKAVPVAVQVVVPAKVAKVVQVVVPVGHAAPVVPVVVPVAVVPVPEVSAAAAEAAIFPGAIGPLFAGLVRVSV